MLEHVFDQSKVLVEIPCLRIKSVVRITRIRSNMWRNDGVPQLLIPKRQKMHKQSLAVRLRANPDSLASGKLEFAGRPSSRRGEKYFEVHVAITDCLPDLSLSRKNDIGRQQRLLVVARPISLLICSDQTLALAHLLEKICDGLLPLF